MVENTESLSVTRQGNEGFWSIAKSKGENLCTF